eukprot:4005735-Pyramimonas_sp.AAC.1
MADRWRSFCPGAPISRIPHTEYHSKHNATSKGAISRYLGVGGGTQKIFILCCEFFASPFDGPFSCSPREAPLGPNDA